MNDKSVVVIEGEDAAPEAMRPTVALIDSLGLPIEWVRPAIGDEGMKKYASLFPEESRHAIDCADATLFGATSVKGFEALFYLRWGKQTYANVRPCRFWPGCNSPLARPEGIDFVFVRENLEDLYVGVEGRIEELSPLGLESSTARRPLASMGPGQYAIKLITTEGTKRIARFAFELARKRKELGRPGLVTCTAKHNMLPGTDGLFCQTTEQVAADYPDIDFETFIVDDFAHRLVREPHHFDVVVLPNLYGDVLSDAGAALVGGLGLAASGCFGDDYAYFEPAHGTAPDIAGKNIINPTATILSACMMLEHLEFEGPASKLRRSLERVYEEGKVLTPDQGGSATATQFCEEIARLF